MGELYIGHLYWIIQRNTGRKNGIKVTCLHAVCTEAACKSVQLPNIGSMCVTALPTQISLISHSLWYNICVELGSSILNKQKFIGLRQAFVKSSKWLPQV